MELPDNARADYENSPVEDRPLIEQVEYWKNRAEFFEKQAYANLENIKREIEEQDESDWWKNVE